MDQELPQLYRWEHVATYDELVAIYKGFHQQQDALKWWQWRERQKLQWAMNGIELVLVWIDAGKDYRGIL